jgi:release factor glutamine methyltransferase
VRHRLAHQPVARITGRKEFWSFEFRVTPATLVPRPETETVVEATLAAIGDRSRALRVADFGTGTGALLLAILSELPNATGFGTDISADALVTAHGNAMRLKLTHRAQFVLCDYGAALGGPFDVVVSNPPYVVSGSLPKFATTIRALRSMAACLDSMVIVRWWRTRAGSSSRTVFWWWSLARVRLPT